MKHIETTRTHTASRLNSVSAGCIILSRESVNSSKPIIKIINETISDATYSKRSCPNGWSRSAGFAEMRKLTNEITDDAASERLLSASAVIEILPASVPVMNFPANRRRFIAIPTMLAIVPQVLRTDRSVGLRSPIMCLTI